MKGIELDEQVLRQLFNEGTPLEAMAQHFGCSRKPVSKAVRHLGLSRRCPNPHRVDLDDEEVLRQMFKAGVPQVQIAEHFGCSQTLISLVIRRLGLVRERLVGGPRGFIFDEDQLCRMFVDGLSLSRIATYFRCSRPTVAKAVGRLCMTREPLFTGNCRHQHPNWRGGRRITSHGYIRVLVGTDCPGADGEGHIFEHRLVMQEALGRPLRDDEVVHHINGIKTDNRLENLTVMTRVEHNEHHKRRRQMARRSREERKNTAMRFAGAL